MSKPEPRAGGASYLELLKYFRVQAEDQFNKVLGREKISACCMGIADSVVIGTEAGMLHILSTAGSLLKSYKSHDMPINDICLDFEGNIACCSDNGTVVVYFNSFTDGLGEDKKPLVVHVNEPVKSISMEGSNYSRSASHSEKYNQKQYSKSSATGNKKPDISFVAGCKSGQLIRYFSSSSWLSQKKQVLFAGAGTPVSTIAWMGNMIAWADASQVRLMDVSSSAAVCYLDCPSGVDPHGSFPCTLVWASYHDLFVGWADSFRHLELMVKSDFFMPASPKVSGTTKGKPPKSAEMSQDIIARTVSDWQADCIICGISAFDSDHIVLLGYTPDEQEAFTEGPEGEDDPLPDAPIEQATPRNNKIPFNEVEIQVCNLFSGEIVVSDLVQMRGKKLIHGPKEVKLCCTYHRAECMADVHAWKVSGLLSAQPVQPADMSGQTSNNVSSGVPPALFIFTPQDMVCAALRDVDDKIGRALLDMDMLLAVNLAASDRYNLSKYKFVDLLYLYVSHLLDEDEWNVAVQECVRLLGHDSDDSFLWERFVYAFSKKGALHKLAPFIPTQSLKLSRNVYQVILDEFLTSHPKDLAQLVEKWAPCASSEPPLFDTSALLTRLQNYRSTSPWHHIAQAHLCRQRGDWAQALVLYLESAGVGSPTDLEQLKTYDFSPVFQMIASQDLFASVQDRVLRLVRLDPARACEFLVKFRDNLQIPVVVAQLRADRSLLYSYLHEMFTKAQEAYNIQEYAEYHALQVALYAEFATPFVKPTPSVGSALSDESFAQAIKAPANHSASADNKGVREITAGPADSPFLLFLKHSHYAPLDLALKECEKRTPPLYHEIIYIHTKMGNIKIAFDLLLKEIGDIHAAIRFTETYDPSLWAQLTEYSLSDGDMLSQVIDYAGISANVNPATVVQKIPPKLAVPSLRKRLVRLNSLFAFRQFVTDQCNDILAEDTIVLQRNLNQLKRKAFKVDPTGARCSACTKPIFVPTDTSDATLGLRTRSHIVYTKDPDKLGGVDIEDRNNEKDKTGRIAGDQASIWGSPLPPALLPSGVLVFSNKLVYHRQCYLNGI